MYMGMLSRVIEANKSHLTSDGREMAKILSSKVLCNYAVCSCLKMMYRFIYTHKDTCPLLEIKK